MRLRISQSLIKDYRSYIQKTLCGLLFEAKWITRTVSTEPTEAMQLGRWFEYLALGPWHDKAGEQFGIGTGEVSGFKAAGKKAVDQWNETLAQPWLNTDAPEILARLDQEMEAHWYAKYFTLYQQAKHLRATFEAYKITPIQIQKKIEVDMGGYDRVMVWDVWAQVDAMPDPNNPGELLPPHQAIIDVKATGLFNDKWNDYGWDTYTIEHRPAIITQPIDYLDLARLDLDLDVPFYFFVHSNTNDVDRKIIQVAPTTGVLLDHRAGVQQMALDLEWDVFKGFKPYPDLKQCGECPLRDECAHRAKHPRLQVVNLI